MPEIVFDPFQQKAMAAIRQGHSVIVAAPTGSGKTVIAECVLQEALRQGRRVIYTAPIKALSNQKFRDFQQQFPDQIGILTGDITLNPGAPALIMTTEIFRNKLLEEKESLKDYSWVIFDEIHYLDDYERGSVWEESLIFLPEHMKILGLSATIPNIDELAAWLKSIHPQTLQIVKEHKRPVPLHFYYQCQGRLYDNLKALAQEGFRSPQHGSYYGRKLPRHVYVKPNKPTALIRYLQERDQLPCIYFVFSRKKTEYLAEEMLSLDFLQPDERKRISLLYTELCTLFDLAGDPRAARMRPFVEQGIAYHHAGMLPTLKEVVERLFTSRLIKLIFTTETFALGVNMPARTVVFDELRKFYGRSFGTLKTRDFYQMAGRAGRRSIDKEGYVFCRVNPHDLSPEDLQRMIYGQPERVVSRFNASYATILHLYAHHGEKLYDIYPLSFHYYQQKKSERKRALELLRAKVNLLKEMGYIRKNRLTENGLFASRVYGYELILTELHNRGLLEELSEKALGVLACAVVFEPRKGMTKPHLPQSTRRLDTVANEVIHRIHQYEKTFQVKPSSKVCAFHLSASLEAWMQGESFEAIRKYTDVDEGEIVRYFRMTMQILRDLLKTPLSSSCQQKMYRLIAAINRDVVDAAKQLRG